MKLRITNYTFTAAAGTIDFNDYVTIDIEGVLLISNVVDNVIIYRFEDPLKGGTVAGNTLTLTFDTSTMSDSDELQIWYEDGSTTQAISGIVTANAGTNLDTSALALEATLQSIKTAVELLDNAVSGSELQVDVLTMPTVTVTATNLDVQSGGADLATSAQAAAIQAAVETIDNAISGNEMQVDVLTMPTVTVQSTNLDIRDLTFAADKVDASGTVLGAGTNSIGDVGLKPRTTGGFTTYHLVSAATTNATVVKASAGQLFGWYVYNSNAAARKLVFHDTASTPTAGASVFFSIVIPPMSGANVFTDIGIAFSTGLAITTVTGLADSDSTGVALNDLIINLFYS